MRTFITILLGLMLLGVVVAAVVAIVEIESIVISGPVCSLFGMLIATLCYRRNLQLGFLFGLSLPTMSVLCFVTIFGLQWSPDEAHWPIGLAIVLFTIPAAPFAVCALHEVRNTDVTKRRAGFQYGIAELIGLMFFTAVVVAFFRHGKTPGMAIAVLIAYGAVAGYIVGRFYVHRRNAASVVPGKELDDEPENSNHPDP